MAAGRPVENSPAGADERAAGTVSFGYRDVPATAKAGLVRGVFESVAGRYDLMNDLMSGGIHRLWKKAMIDWLLPRPGMQLLDVAGGTGDIAFRVLDRLGPTPPERLIVCDLTPDMLEAGRRRARGHAHAEQIEWVCGDAERLPLPNACVDAYTIAFGLRNVTHLRAALDEAFRVLRPGGRFLCLEFSHVVLPLLAELYDRYSFTVLPWLGERVAGDREAYLYLAESIRRFPNQAELATALSEAGFELVKLRNLSGGIAALHSAWRI